MKSTPLSLAQLSDLSPVLHGQHPAPVHSEETSTSKRSAPGLPPMASSSPDVASASLGTPAIPERRQLRLAKTKGTAPSAGRFFSFYAYPLQHTASPLILGHSANRADRASVGRSTPGWIRHRAGPEAQMRFLLRGRCPLAKGGGLVRGERHIRDLSTSNSAPGEDGSKPCSISQRAATRLRHDHHPRITSRSTSVP
jgi:hypothetical protein